MGMQHCPFGPVVMYGELQAYGLGGGPGDHWAWGPGAAKAKSTAAAIPVMVQRMVTPFRIRQLHGGTRVASRPSLPHATAKQRTSGGGNSGKEAIPEGAGELCGACGKRQKA